MNLDILKDSLINQGIETGSIVSYYSFTDFSGGLFFNDVYSKNSHICSGNGDYIDLEKFPLISLKDGSCLANSTSGSGYFNYQELLQIGTGIDIEDWTIFFSIDKTNYTDGNSGVVLVSTQDTPNSLSGFTIGINSSDRPFFEYNVYEDEIQKYIYTHPETVGDKAVYSVSKNSGLVELTKHQPTINQDAYSLFFLSGYDNSTNWYVGNFKNSSSVESSEGYTGYSGYIDNLVILDEGITSNQKTAISRGYIQADNGFTTGFFSGFATGFADITGSVVNVTGITGSGVTGHVCVYQDVTFDACDGNLLSGFAQSGVTGNLFGLSIEYLTGAVTSGTGFVFVSGTEIIDSDSTLSYSANQISFQKTIENNDVYEIHSQNTYTSGLNNQSFYVALNNSRYADIYTGGNLNVYRTGFFVPSGSGYSIINGDEIVFTEDTLSATSDGTEYVSYDYIFGDQVEFPTGGSFTGSDINISGSGDQYGGKEVFYSESGSYSATKLVSGLDWSGLGDHFQIEASGRGSGIYIFAPIQSESYNRATGSGVTLVNTDFGLLNEQVWLNGVKQRRGEDYILSVSGNDSINQSVIASQPFINFNNLTGYWNI